MYDYILLDLDGTLTDSGPGITNAAAYALKQAGFPVPPRTELYKFVGPPLWDTFRLYGLQGDAVDKAVADFRVYYAAGGQFESTVYAGVMEFLKAASEAGKTLALCTSKQESSAEKIVKHFGFDRYIPFIAGGVDGVRTAKDQVVAYALELIATRRGCPVDKNRTVLIGDTRFDILGAKKVGITSVGVLYGFGSREELEASGADFIVGTASELMQII